MGDCFFFKSFLTFFYFLDSFVSLGDDKVSFLLRLDNIERLTNIWKRFESSDCDSLTRKSLCDSLTFVVNHQSDFPFCHSTNKHVINFELSFLDNNRCMNHVCLWIKISLNNKALCLTIHVFKQVHFISSLNDLLL